MRPFVLLAACIIGALVAGPLLAWPLHFAPPFSGMPFDKVAAMSTEIAAVVFGLLFLYMTAGIDRRTLGWGFTLRDLRSESAAALLAGTVFIAVLESALLLLGIHVPSGAAAKPAMLADLALRAIAVGLAVAVVEETLFRGALFSGLQRPLGAAGTLLLTGAVYAAVHFIKFPPLPGDTDVRWHTGLDLLAGGFWRFGSPIVIDSFITLFALGLLLGLMRLARGHIAQCIGFHAGVVAGLKVAGELTDYRRGSDFDFLVNRWDPELGWLAVGFIVLTATVYGLLFLRARRA
jgi:hypothetical protein